VLGLAAPHDHGEERRFLFPPSGHGHPEHRSGDPGLGVPQLGVVGQLAGEVLGRLTWANLVGRDGIEPPTLRFSAARSTD
jgi:hypothetical protein